MPLIENLATGSVLAAFSVLLHTIGLMLVARVTPPFARHLGMHNSHFGRTFVMTATVLGILGILTVEVWLWSGAYLWLGIVSTLDEALFLSTTMFSTLGYLEVDFDRSWRLLTALEGTTGFLMIGWSTAFLVRASTRHGPFQTEHF